MGENYETDEVKKGGAASGPRFSTCKFPFTMDLTGCFSAGIAATEQIHSDEDGERPAGCY